MSNLDHSLRAALHADAESAPDTDAVVAALHAAVAESGPSTGSHAADVTPMRRRRPSARLVWGWAAAAAVVVIVGASVPALLRDHEHSGPTSVAGAGPASGTNPAGSDPSLADTSALQESFGKPVTLPSVAEGHVRHEARIPATLRLENGCLVARVDSTSHLVVWQPGTTATLADGLVVVHDASGRRVAGVGDEIFLPDEPHPAGPEVQGTAQCPVSASTVVATAPAQHPR